MKKLCSIIIFIVLIITLNFFKVEHIFYIPFKIPGSQMAATIPPFGIFIESDYKYNKSLINHETIHWNQYKDMGLLMFYKTYFIEYSKYGRINSPMEKEARKLSRKL